MGSKRGGEGEHGKDNFAVRSGGQGAKRVSAALQVRPGHEKNTKVETGREGTTLVSSGNQEITGVYTSYMTVASFEAKRNFT